MKAPTRRSWFQLLPFGIQVIAGVVGVLASLHYLLSPKDQAKKDQSKKDRSKSAEAPAASRPTPAEPIELAAEPTKRKSYFAIRRTKSELGYVYWVLQGFGEFRCYLLCDSWREAMDEASLRIQACRENGCADGSAAVEALAVTA